MNAARLNQIRRLLWIYIFLLIFEGALRRWILPSLSSPLLMVRDPIALVALWFGWPLLQQHKFQQWIQPLMFFGLCSFFLALTVGHQDIFVAVYGARILVLHLPLIFLYPAVFSRSDVIRFAWIFAWVSIPMTILIVIQSSVPSTHILNVAPGGEGSAVFTGALDRFRPPGTFSFITGVVSFYTLALASFFSLIYGCKLGMISRVFLSFVGIALVVAQPVSMSRNLLAGYLQIIVALIVALLLSRTKILPIIAGLLAFLLIISVARQIPVFQDTSEAFAARWEEAADTGDERQSSDTQFGGGMGQFRTRILGTFLEPLDNVLDKPFLGLGIGMGTSVGAIRISGVLGFNLGEGSWEIGIAEMGLPLGLSFIIWRLALGLWILRLALRQAALKNPLPLIFLGCSFLQILNGQLAQSTGLGFLVVSSGITLAACNIQAESIQFRSNSLNAVPS